MFTLNGLVILALITIASNTLVIYSNTQMLKKVKEDA